MAGRNPCDFGYDTGQEPYVNCPSCAASNPSGAKFCLNCGTKLELPRPAEGERRFVTVMFADVVGSTAMAEQIDPEQVTEIMHGAFSVFNTAVARYGGTVSRLMGDAVLAIFGAPVAHEDDPERAVHAGLAILDSAAEYTGSVRQAYGVDFQVRVGIHSGLAVLAMMGDEIKTEYTAMGDTANVASRLQNLAAPGTVLISGETYHLVKNIFETRDLGPVEIKGKSLPMAVYEVLKAKPSREKLRGLDGLSSPLVGRAQEESAVRERISAAVAGRGSILAVIGEAGLGKSRLLAEVHRWATSLAESVTWLEGRALSYGQTIAYYPWRQIIRQSLGVHENDPPEEQRSRLEAAVSHGDALYLERLLAIESEESRGALSGLRGDELLGQITESVRRFVTSHSDAAPTVLIFDDLHWADEPSLELLTRLADLVGDRRLLIVCILRPDKAAGSWKALERIERAAGDNFTRVELEPLSPGASQQLLGNLLHVEDLPESVRELILRKSDGNPFFIEEVIRSLIDSGHIVQVGDHWRATGAIADVAIPDTLAGVLAARIDRLPDETKRVVQTAAVIGRIFQYPVLSETCTDAPLPERIEDASPHVETLTDEGLVRERARDPELEYIFKHALTQEAAYDLLLLRRRKTYHHRVAEVLERLYPGQLDDLAPVLARHFWLSEDWEQAADLSMRAAKASMKVYAIREAVDHYDRTYQALKRLPEPPLEQAIDAVVEWAQFAYRFESYEAIVARLGEVEPLARQLGDKRRLANVLSWTMNAHGSAGFPSRGMAAMAEAYELNKEIGDELLGLFPLFVMSHRLVDQNPREALGPISEVIELAEKHGQPHIQAHALTLKAMAYSRLGKFRQAEETLRHARETVQHTDVAATYADVNTISALVYFDMGEIERGLQHSTLGMEQAMEAGAGECTVYSMYTTGIGQMYKPDPTAAENVLQQSMERLHGLSNDQLRYLNSGALAMAQSLAGEPDAVAKLEAVMPNAQAMGDEYTTARLSVALADRLAANGDLDRADEHLASALEYYRRNEMRPYIARALQSLARLRDLQGRAAEADAARAESERLAEELRAELPVLEEAVAAEAR